MDTGDQQHPQQQQQQLPQQQQQQQHQQQQQQQYLHPQQGHLRGSGRGSGRPSPACSPVSSMDVEVLEPYGDSPRAAPDYLHNQHHKHRAEPWDSLVGGGQGGGHGGGGGGGGHNSVCVTLSPAVTVTPSSSLSTLPSPKVQCVLADSSEEESGHPASHGSTLQRLRTEPFTPRLEEEVEVSDDDDERGGGSVFEESRAPPRGLPLRLSPNPLGPNPGLGRNSQHIPAMEGVNHSTTASSSTAKHKASHLATTLVSPASASPMDVTSVCVSGTSGVTSTTGSGGASSVRLGGEKDAAVFSGGGAERTSQLPHSARRSSGGVSGGGGGSGSISCVNSSGVSVISGGAVAVAVSSVSVSQTNVVPSLSSAGSALVASTTPQPFRWEMRPRTDWGDRASPKAVPIIDIDLFSADKSDSSASSPLRMDIDENVSSSPRSDHDNESRSSCPPKVPPLKIILPSQKTSAAPHTPDKSKNLLTKPALPYVLNPTQCGGEADDELEVGEWEEEVGGAKVPPPIPPPPIPQALQDEDPLHVGTPSPSPASPSRPSSRAGSSDRDDTRNSGGGRPALESSPLVREGGASGGSGREDEDGGGDRQGEEERGGEEARPTRTLRSHTAMKQQQQEQKHHKVGGGVGKAESVKDAQDRGSRADPRGLLFCRLCFYFDPFTASKMCTFFNAGSDLKDIA